MKLSEGVEAAIHSVTILASLGPGETMPAAAFADAYEISASYLLKHLKALVADGLLESVSGPQGGYRLARAAKTITLLDVVLAIEGRQPAFRCTEIRQRGPVRLPAEVYAKPCQINAAMLKAERAYRAALAETSIADIAAEFNAEADPRAVVAACAFAQQNKRPQGRSKSPKPKEKRHEAQTAVFQRRARHNEAGDGAE